MIKHILLWQFQDSIKGNTAEEDRILAMLSASVAHMVGRIDGLLTAEIARNISDNEWDFVFYTEFTDAKALEQYQSHPLHVKHKEMAAPYLKARLAADWVR